MCGYVRRKGSKSVILAYLKKYGLDEAWLRGELGDIDKDDLLQFYPAFGGAADRQIKGLIIRENGITKAVNATWWFDCSVVDGRLVVNNSRTTFNARNLASPYWKGAVRHNRGLVVATGLGEGKQVDGKNRHYLVEAQEPFFLGAVYRAFPEGFYSTAIITRDEHPRFSEFHDKAFPLFLPDDPAAIELWLSDAPETDPGIAALLDRPRLYHPLCVTQVKTFKRGEPIGEPIELAADLLS